MLSVSVSVSVSVRREVSPFTFTFFTSPTHFEPIRIRVSNRETAAQYLTYSMCQFEARGASLLLKLLVTDLWTLFWTILFINLNGVWI